MNDHPKLLHLPNVGGKGFTKAEIELLQEMDPDIVILPDGSYTINGQPSEEINATYKKSMEDLVRPKKELKYIKGKKGE